MSNDGTMAPRISFSPARPVFLISSAPMTSIGVGLVATDPGRDPRTPVTTTAPNSSGEPASGGVSSGGAAAFNAGAASAALDACAEVPASDSVPRLAVVASSYPPPASGIEGDAASSPLGDSIAATAT